MIDYHRLGSVPAKHHIQLPREEADVEADAAPVYYEHCVTRGGFDGGYSILYRKHNPGRESGQRDSPLAYHFEPADADQQRLVRHHYPTPKNVGKGALWESHRVWCGNDDIHVGSAEPSVRDSGLVQDADGDLLLFIHEGSGHVDSEMGRLSFRRHDYVWIPKGVIHRIHFDRGDVRVLVLECRAGLQIPSNFTNPVGQLKMDAPYSHRDFRRPEALSDPSESDSDDDGHYVVHNKRDDRWTERLLPHHPFDVVGWDGTVYPVAFNVHDYQPKTSTVHLPPPIHTTFLGGGGSFVVCSFVPRKVDYHPEAIPCPYPHSSVDCDEVLWYVEGNFTSRKGVGPGSISHHPMGIPHAPQPGRYEASIGTEATDELAVMVDTFKPLRLSKHAATHEDRDYHGSWADGGDPDGTYVD